MSQLTETTTGQPFAADVGNDFAIFDGDGGLIVLGVVKEVKCRENQIIDTIVDETGAAHEVDDTVIVVVSEGSVFSENGAPTPPTQVYAAPHP